MINSSGPNVSASLGMPLLGSYGIGLLQDGVGGPSTTIDNDAINLPTTEESALIAPHNPLGTFIDPSNDQILVYTVQPGDTPSTIAENFGISLNTLLWANNLRNPDLIHAGDELIILPVSGVKYEVKKGDTIESIAKQYKGDPLEILAFNGLAVGEPLEVGSIIIIPDGELTSSVPSPTRRASISRVSTAVLHDAAGYFMRPIFGGRRSRGLHGYNAVDLAQSCGEAVLAAAEGTIIITRPSGWNGGYGHYLVMSHPNGTQTLYAHLATILGRVGQYVAQGSQIATIGSTGNSTGCHLHFEVRGAKNPF